MTPLRLARRILALAAILAAPLGAQSSPRAELLTLPEGAPLLCRVETPDASMPPALQALVHRRFLVPDAAATRPVPPGLPEQPARSIDVAYDSTGTPFVVMDQVSRPRTGSEQAMVLFGSDGQTGGQRISVPIDTLELDAATATGDRDRALAAVGKPVVGALEPTDVARARTLAAWLWERRCGRGGAR